MAPPEKKRSPTSLWCSVVCLHVSRSRFPPCNAPMLTRPPSRPFMAMEKPWPSAPTRLATGTRQSSKLTIRVGCEFHPTCVGRRVPTQQPDISETCTGNTMWQAYLFLFLAKGKALGAFLDQQARDALGSCAAPMARPREPTSAVYTRNECEVRRTRAASAAHDEVDVAEPAAADKGLRAQRCTHFKSPRFGAKPGLRAAGGPWSR